MSIKYLSDEEAKKRLKEFGYNEISPPKKGTFLKIFFNQLINPMIYILLIAAFISHLVGDVFSFWFIISIITFIILIGFILEYKGEKAVEALKKFVKTEVKVLRDGVVKKIDAKEVVPGDVVILEAGDKVPADGEILEEMNLKVDESLLTGESLPVEKKVGDEIFAGTLVVNGKCKVLITKTGRNTKIGQISKYVEAPEEKTPLQQKIDTLVKQLSILAFFITALIFIFGLFFSSSIYSILMTALAISVGTIPEALPLVLTITLAYGMYNMAKSNAIVKRMVAAETLGSVTVICTDKTGTLTKNQMHVEKIYTNGKIYDANSIDTKKDKALEFLLKIGVLCNNAELKSEDKVIGDPTEGALLILGHKENMLKDGLEKDYERVYEILFTSERKMMTTIHKHNEKYFVFSKGATEVILNKCRYILKENRIEEMSKKDVEEILKVNNKLASEAYRVLSLAYKEMDNFSKDKNEVEKDLIFVGLIGMADALKENVKEAIELCKRLGVKVAMITGDNPITAKAIAKRLGIYEERKIEFEVEDKLLEIIKDGIITGDELERMSDEEFEKVVDYINIYARTLPEQKLRIVNALKKKGHVVAMTGDGVNDAPALKKADIGVAMGSGSDVAKEASDLILQDDNFSTIVEAIRIGRTIYNNIKSFTSYFVSTNYCEVFLILMSIFLLGADYLPLLATHILIINMIAEDLPAVTIGLDFSGTGYKKPISPKEKIFGKKELILSFGLAISMAFVLYSIYVVNLSYMEKARAILFSSFISMLIANTLNFKVKGSIFNINVKNRLLIFSTFTIFLILLILIYTPLNTYLGFAPLAFGDWIYPIISFILTLAIGEILKRIYTKF
ncbi:cation-translocating P-type ATPase [Methanocaldococcus fervens]|uniref:ATPase, P-type (Transporting), HAD superfamily, subfamily IC n=1 Tax=Methanocaldococcus fervens (strain DSM 4213 / JCM 15782 / AG86) TaxID=573064 RepID=C7P914_METFA|nr:cation-translocating P-type ATPase [Methanocaldococcus fervens]ACV25046.1 ATPase, P-type (transporting), HAD superfamily, subfamily IC [Methanocaldococcus fervens AG86]